MSPPVPDEARMIPDGQRSINQRFHACSHESILVRFCDLVQKDQNGFTSEAHNITKPVNDTRLRFSQPMGNLYKCAVVSDS